MKGQEFDGCDIPFDGYFVPQVEQKRIRSGCPFRGHGQRDYKPGYVSFGKYGPVNHGHHHHGPDHHRRGPPEDGHRPGCGRWGPPKHNSDRPSEHHFHGPPPGFRPDHDNRPHDFHGHGPSSHNFGPKPWWFGRRGPSESAERPWTGPNQRRP